MSQKTIPKRTILPDALDEVVAGLLEDGDHVLVEGVHVLGEPLFAAVVHLACIVHQTEARLGGGLFGEFFWGFEELFEGGGCLRGGVWRVV